MATPQLPSTTSLVDFLASQKQNASFAARRKLYNDLGFSRRLGEYAGSPSQNLNLLRELQKQNQPATPTPETPAPAQSPVRMAPSGMESLSSAMQSLLPSTPRALAASTEPTLQTPAPQSLLTSRPPTLQTPAPPTQPRTPERPGVLETLRQIPSLGSIIQSGELSRAIRGTPAQTFVPEPRTGISSIASLAQAGMLPERVAPPTAEPVPPTPPTPPTPEPALPTQDEVAVSEAQNIDTRTRQDIGLSASQLYPDIFGQGTAGAGEADLVNQWLESSEGRLFMERQDLRALNDEAKADLAKAELESRYQSERASLEQKLAANGLAFSGIRASRVKALADSLAESQLGVDRELASKLLDANLNLREGILRGVADLAKNARDGRREAIQQLNSIGYAVVGDQLVPTLTSQREERAMRAEERAKATAQRAERSLGLSERRLALAEEAATRRATNAARLYSNLVKTSLERGQTPEDALTAAVNAAGLSGVILNVEEQTAILDEARRLQPTITVQETAQAPNAPETGFFNRLYGGLF